MIADIVFSSSVFVALTMTLTLLLLGARALLVSQGCARVTVNGKRLLDASLGGKLLEALEQAGIGLPAACGGVGTCGMCRVTVMGAGDALPTERAVLSAAQIAAGVRLACQQVVRGDLAVTVPSDLLMTERWLCTVARTRTVAPLIVELRLALPQGRERSFLAGSFVQVAVPPFTLPFADINVDPAFEGAWQRLGLRQLTAQSRRSVSRAYSLVNHPGETGELILNIRLALPPAGQPDAPPGVGSSYLFGLTAGATVEASGPFGDFFIADTDREIILIGGGVGMAPLRAHVFDQLECQHTTRRIGYWYGARSRVDLYYADDMERLARAHANFSWHVALSDPAPDDEWAGETGFIHEVVHRTYLQSHADPAACEYYLCGPPLMIDAVQAMLQRLNVPPGHIRNDDFGG